MLQLYARGPGWVSGRILAGNVRKSFMAVLETAFNERFSTVVADPSLRGASLMPNSLTSNSTPEAKGDLFAGYSLRCS